MTKINRVVFYKGAIAMSKLRKKIVVPITLILVVCLVVGTLVIYDSLTSVEANVSFNGISNIVSSHGKDRPFNIVEVVPSKQEYNNMASIGYLIGGQEPVNSRQMLSTIIGDNGTGIGSGAIYRPYCMYRLFYEDYHDFVTDDANDKSRPLFWSPYSESYTKGVDDCNTPLDLAGTETLEAGENGTRNYEMVRKDGGSYRLDTEYVPAVKDGNPCGNYNQNVDHYVYMPASLVSEDGQETKPVRGYYGVVFKEADEHINITNYDYFNAKTTDGLNLDVTKKAYKVKSAYAIADQHTMNSIAESDPHAAIYRIDNSDISLAYEYAGLAESYKKAEGDEAQAADKADNIEASNTADYDTYTYYTLQMEYVPSDEVVNEGVTYYEVDDEKTLFFEDQSGEYGAVLDEKEPYINLNPDNSQSETRKMGYFNIKEGSQVYNFAGEGCGEYEIQKKENGVLDHPVNVRRIYTKGGFTNNELFRNGVFNQDGSGKSDNMSFNVQTVTPAEMDHINWSDVDLLYISGGDGSGSASYGYGNDIKGKTIFDVAKRVHESGFMMPVIVDYSLVKDNVDQPWNFRYHTNMERLAALLCCSNYAELAIDKIDPSQYENPLCVNWYDDDNGEKIKFDTRVDSNHPNGYVNGNIYVIPGNIYKKPTDDDKGHGAAFLLQNFNTSFLDCTGNNETEFVNQAKNQGFGEIAEYINSENTSRKNENETLGKDEYAYYDKKISKAIVLSYIISYVDKRDIINPTDSLNILDIEPGTVKNESGALNYDKLTKWLGSRCPEKKKVKITRVTSAEFIGRIEDLNNYDMIYMGLVADNLNYDKDGHTVYNDWNMNGLKYSNVGDIVVIDPSDDRGYWGEKMLRNGHAGLLDTDYINGGDKLNTTLTLRKNGHNKYYITAPNTYRGSGNDITKQKVSEFEDYIKAGFPVVFSDGFFSNDSKYESGINEDYIDNCSNVFTLLCDVKDKDNVLKVDSNGDLKNKSNETAQLITYLTTEKPEILLKEQEKVKDTDYVEISNNQITLEFSINNAGGADSKASFNAQLFLDSNSDGKFSTTNEGIDANKIKIYCDGTIVNPVMGDNGKYMYSLNAGNYNYKLVYDLPNGYVGVMPWQLRVSQATNSYRYDQKSGYVYVKNSKGSPTKVKILQINSHLKHNPEYNGNFDMQVQKNDDTTKFHELLSQVKDFDLDIETVYYDDVDKMNEVCNKLQTYDMLVIGFGDCYDINNNLDNIKAYIQSGKPVLFAHDTTSFCNNKIDTPYNNFWGYKFNSKIRDSVGLDRYGILSNEYLKKGNTLYSTDYRTDADFDKAVKTAEKNNTDIAYEPKSYKKVIVRQNQGFTYADLNHYQWKDNGDDHGEYRLYSGLVGNDDVQAYTNKAVKVNSGQITTYPFKIADEINIATTHNQYYQLDMNQDADGDGESDIVVWYTLSDIGVYEQSPKDVRNNYYIYTMGNVTYSGVGHSDFSNNEDELKLYINTMIAAYSASVHEPSIYLKENADTDSNDITTLYATIDDAIEEEAANKADARLDGADSTQDVYFTVKDSNLVRNQIDEKTVVYLDFYIEDPQKNPNDETIGTGDNKIYLKKVDWDIYSLNNDGTENQRINNSKENSQLNKDPRNFFENNKTYKVKVPLSVLPEGANSIKIYAVGYSKIYQSLASGECKEIPTAKAYKTFQIQRVGLADLD